MRFEWDAAKAELNRRKHGVTFELAVRVFADPAYVTVQDRIEEGEPRWRTLGLVDGTVLLLVAHLWFDDEEGEVIRIISARRATRAEWRRYDEENG
jgi:uncharacterized DUF497 family protein